MTLTSLIAIQIEKFTPPADGSSTDDRVDPSIHGDKGMLPNGLPEFPLSLDNSIVKASKELPEEFPYNPEPNGPSHIGIGKHDFLFSREVLTEPISRLEFIFYRGRQQE